MRAKKAQTSQTHGKVVTVILVVVVIVLVAWVVFKVDFIAIFKNLIPDYSYDDSDTELILPDEQIALNAICKNRVGAIVKEGDKFYIHMGNNKPYKRTDLIFRSPAIGKGDIDIDKTAFYQDNDFGKYDSEKGILIYSKWFKENIQKDYSNSVLPSAIEMQQLNGAKLIDGSAVLCKDEK